MRASADVLEGKVSLDPIGVEMGGALWAENESVGTSPDAQIDGPVWFGENVKIKGGAILMGLDGDPRAHGSRHGPHPTEHHLAQHVHRGAGRGPAPSSVGSAALGRRRWSSTARSSATIPPSARARLFSRAVKRSGWNKEVEDGATVTTSLIWGSRGKRTLFGRFGVTGQVNIDMTPEVCGALRGGLREHATQGIVGSAEPRLPSSGPDDQARYHRRAPG